MSSTLLSTEITTVAKINAFFVLVELKVLEEKQVIIRILGNTVNSADD